MEEWLYYNFAVETFHTQNSVAYFIRQKLNFYSQKRQIRSLSQPFGDLHG